MRIVPRALLAIAVPIMLLAVAGTPARAAETLVYDVTTSIFSYFPQGPVLSSTTERVLITDRGPQTDASPRWTTESLGRVAIFDEPGGAGPPDNLLFGNSCAVFVTGPSGSLSRDVEVAAAGGGDFAWLSGFDPTGAIDPYAFFCLKW